MKLSDNRSDGALVVAGPESLAAQEKELIIGQSLAVEKENVMGQKELTDAVLKVELEKILMALNQMPELKAALEVEMQRMMIRVHMDLNIKDEAFGFLAVVAKQKEELKQMNILMDFLHLDKNYFNKVVEDYKSKRPGMDTKVFKRFFSMNTSLFWLAFLMKIIEDGLSQRFYNWQMLVVMMGASFFAIPKGVYKKRAYLRGGRNTFFENGEGLKEHDQDVSKVVKVLMNFQKAILESGSALSIDVVRAEIAAYAEDVLSFAGGVNKKIQRKKFFGLDDRLKKLEDGREDLWKVSAEVDVDNDLAQGKYEELQNFDQRLAKYRDMEREASRAEGGEDAEVLIKGRPGEALKDRK